MANFMDRVKGWLRVNEELIYVCIVYSVFTIGVVFADLHWRNTVTAMFQEETFWGIVWLLLHPIIFLCAYESFRDWRNPNKDYWRYLTIAALVATIIIIATFGSSYRTRVEEGIAPKYSEAPYLPRSNTAI